MLQVTEDNFLLLSHMPALWIYDVRGDIVKLTYNNDSSAHLNTVLPSMSEKSDINTIPHVEWQAGRAYTEPASCSVQALLLPTCLHKYLPLSCLYKHFLHLLMFLTVNSPESIQAYSFYRELTLFL